MDGLRWQDRELSLLCAKTWPEEERWVTCRSYEEVAEKLREGYVSQENLVGIAVGYGYALAALAASSSPDFEACLARASETLVAAAPAPGEARRALGVIDGFYQQFREDTEQRVTAILAGAVTVHRQDVIAARSQSRTGREIFPEAARVLLRSTAEGFHSGVFGGALGILVGAARKPGIDAVFLAADGRGNRQEERLAHTLMQMQESFSAHAVPQTEGAMLMALGALSGGVDLLLLDGLRLAANGDILAPAGSYALAIAAYFHSIPVYAALYAQQSSFDCPSGRELLETLPPPAQESRLAGLPAFDRAVDMVPGFLLTALLSDRGILCPPYDEEMQKKLLSPPDRHVLTL